MEGIDLGSDQLLPAYNIQIGVADEYIAVVDVNHYRSDMDCFVPLMEKFRGLYGFEVQLEIESGHVKIASEQIEGEAIREADGTLEDGALVLRFADETETTEMRLMLLEDGTLSDYEGSDAELGDLYYYFEKAE